MKLFIGLGNPGTKYQNTRHNLGASILTEFCHKHNVFLKEQSKFIAKIGELSKNYFAISTDYMNNSGFTVQKIAHYFKINPSDIYIIHDDLDIEAGEYKIQFDRGAAGHNGIKSTIEQLNTQAFNRIRVGIGKPQDSTPIENYVLLPFIPDQKEKINQILPEIIKEIENLIK